MFNAKTITLSAAVLAAVGLGIIHQLSQQNKLAEESNGLQQGANIEAQVQEQVRINQAKKNKQLEQELIKSATGR